MRACEQHWAQMRGKIDAVGLSPFITATSREAVGHATLDLIAHSNGDIPSVSDWDPLMTMNWNFFARVTQEIGLEIMGRRIRNDGMPGNDGHYCPLCVVRHIFDVHNTATGTCDNPECPVRVKPGELPWDEGWIDVCGDLMLTYALEKGLVTRQ